MAMNTFMNFFFSLHVACGAYKIADYQYLHKWLIFRKQNDLCIYMKYRVDATSIILIFVTFNNRMRNLMWDNSAGVEFTWSKIPTIF